MNENNRLSRVQILIQQKKYAEAEKTLNDLLSTDAGNAHYLLYMAEIKLQMENYEMARKIIDSAIGISPDYADLYFQKSRIVQMQENYDEAEEVIRHAILLDPNNSGYYAFQAHLRLNRKKFKEALDIANRALEIEPENLLALNTRSTALTKLNRKEESFKTIEGALREDPNNAFTHANYGWSLLEKGDHKKAMEHFKESLKSDPDFEYAQSGILQAMKAKNPIYSLYLQYAFFMQKLTARYQWTVIIAFYLGFRILKGIAKSNEALQPYLIPLLIGLAIIAFSTWVINPIGNLFLRFNKYGQLLLSKKEKLSSGFVALSLAVFTVGLALYFILGDQRYLMVAFFGFAMMVPCGVMFAPTKFKDALLIYTIAMAAVGAGAIFLTFTTPVLVNTMSIVFLFGFVIFQWVANFLLIKENNR
ncbi:MAG: tetratricopeptide repeat protein [Bacteroidales bacterium]|nr:tetratricopeptide repeat protein [Bacteroidales bacterium]